MLTLSLIQNLIGDLWASEHLNETPVNLNQRESLGYFLGRLFKEDFMPHGHCFFWKPEIVWLHVISDALIAISYFAIPITLFYFIRKKKNFPFLGIFALFGAFIFWCGTSHIMNIITLWHPVYRADGIVKAITAGVSLVTAFKLYSLIPQALRLRSPDELEQLNQQLAKENKIRQEAEQKLEQANTELEKKVSERTHLLKIKTQELARSNSELEQFAYVASHDLQEPLRMISSYCQLIKEENTGKLSEEVESYLDYAIDGSLRMKDMIDNLLGFSQLDRFSEEDLELVDCQEVVDLAIENLKKPIEESHATIQVGELPTVHSNSNSLVRLFQNLLSNALKYCPKDESPNISIECRLANNKDWQFSVSDKGIGIESTHRERIFAIFQRLHSRTEYPGTGMGLAICKKIVENFHGSIWVESEPGKGSTFYFTIPKKDLAEDRADEISKG